MVSQQITEEKRDSGWKVALRIIGFMAGIIALVLALKMLLP